MGTTVFRLLGKVIFKDYLKKKGKSFEQNFSNFYL